MTALAAQFCDKPTEDFKREIEDLLGQVKPNWGKRRAIINDLSPVATFIASGYNLPTDINLFEYEGNKLLKNLKNNIGWMYETQHEQTGELGEIEYTVWSQVFECPNCTGEISFYHLGLDEKTKRVNKSIKCPSCSGDFSKKDLIKLYENHFDSNLSEFVKKPKRIPALISYKVNGKRFQKSPNQYDLEIIAKVNEMEWPTEIPKDLIPKMHMTHERARMDHSGVTHFHHFFQKRAAISLGFLWSNANSIEEKSVRRLVKFWIEQSIWSMSLMNKYEPIQFGRADGSASQVGRFMKGVYYISSLHTECSPFYVNSGKFKRLVKLFSKFRPQSNNVGVTCGSATTLPLKDNSIDYVFTDPPFGENIYYSDLNFLIEEFHRVTTNSIKEAIVDRCKNKDLHQYQNLMQRAFEEYFRVLKPGRWITIVFSNSKASVWNAIQVALQQSGFVVAEVTALDKKQGSYRQVTSTTAVKQDLVISAYKPTQEIENKFEVSVGNSELIWDFIESHLNYLPITKFSENELKTLPERTAKVLFDRAIAWFVKHNKLIPLSAYEFHDGLKKKFIERDSMFFLPKQASEYAKARIKSNVIKQMEIFVIDEISSIEWLKQIINSKPITQQELQPLYLQEITSWKKSEHIIELKEVLEQNFIKYDGSGEVPSQIHAYLSTNFKDMRGLAKDDPALVAKAKDRWYVPDPNKAGDLEKVRLRALLREFEVYKAEKKKIKQPRAEALRAGFNHCWENQDLQTILDISAKIPPAVLQEDEKLLMFYDNAVTLTSNTDDDWD